VIEPAELLTTSWSVAADAAVGPKLTVVVTDWPGARLDPTAGTPVTVNGTPGSVTALMVSGTPPEFEITTELFRVLPSVTDPNATDVGLTANCAGFGRTLIVTFETACRSYKNGPVEPLNPSITCGGNATVPEVTAIPSIETLRVALDIVTTTW